MNEFSWGFITGMCLFPAVLTGLGAWLYLMSYIEKGRSVEELSEEPLPGPIGTPKNKNRTMWDQPDPYVPKDKRPIGDDS